MKKATQLKKKSEVLLAPFTTENEFRTLFKIGMFCAKLQVSRYRLKKTEKGIILIVKSSIDMLLDSEEFIRALKEFPFRITDDVRVKVALRILCHLSSSAKNKYSKWSEELLRNAGLTVFIPSHPKNRTGSAWLYYWQQHPEELITLVRSYEIKIQGFADLGLTWRENKSNFKKAFVHLHKRPMPKGLLPGERLLQLTTIALAFIHNEYKVPYESLKKYYFKSKKQFKYREPTFEEVKLLT